MKQKTSLQRPVYLFSTHDQLMLNGVKGLIYSRPILLFFCWLFDNVSAIRFMFTGKIRQPFYYNLSKGENRKRLIDTNTTCSQDLLIHPFFMLNCMRLRNPWSLIKYQSPEETDESRPLFKVSHKRMNKSYTYSVTSTFVMLHWETSTSEPSWSFFLCIAPSIRFKFSLSSVYSLLFFPCHAL